MFLSLNLLGEVVLVKVYICSWRFFVPNGCEDLLDRLLALGLANLVTVKNRLFSNIFFGIWGVLGGPRFIGSWQALTSRWR